ncbi:MAG: hypothetical protein EOP53_03125 [Sphingobacteriales bacterium]|nr:MAG: hypothetical protein EOP53_03125 [Sphingobacteriales bacterium]
MATKEHYFTRFEDENFYHVYNRSIDKKPLFKSDDNYIFFLKKYNEYISEVADTYSYCLLGNHFHILLRVKDLRTFKKFSNLEIKSTHEIVSHQLKKFFQSYAMAFNKQQERTGTLFQTPFKRALVNNEAYFTQLVYYIHANPQLHGIVNDFREWKWSSYDRILVDKQSALKKHEVIEWFGNIDKFKDYHERIHKVQRNIIIEDEL